MEQDEGAALGVEDSLSHRRWIWRRGEEQVGLGIAQRLGVPEVVGRLLAARGVAPEAAGMFLEPTLRALMPDPSRLRDMDEAAERLARAVETQEQVAVFGDYDVDGTCSAALLAGLLEELGCEVAAYVPDRLTEGYGPNAAALGRLADAGATLVVCVDCGTAAGTALGALAGRADAIVLDHHKAEGPPPPVLATVNPNRLDCSSGMGSLCAAGVVFLAAVALLRALRRRRFFGERAEPDLLARLDLVALATVCDVMPLTGLNRALVTQGLKVMSRRERPGIAALLEVAQVRDRPSAATLGFALGPRINAAGRIDECDLGVRLMLTTDKLDARRLAERLDDVNRQRQAVEAGMLDAALEAAQAQFAAGHAVAVVAGEEWHPGVVGIVAGRIKERFNRPACVAALLEGMARGSGRSVVGLDLGSAVIAARQAGLLATGGGHAMAAGFSLPADKLDAFHEFLDERLAGASALPPAAALLVEGSVAVQGCTLDLAQALGQLAPFGNGNEEPTLILPRVRVVRADRVGRDGATLRVFLEGEGGGRLKGVMFRAGEGALAQALLARDQLLHLAGHLRAEEWNGNISPGFIIRDGAPV